MGDFHAKQPGLCQRDVVGRSDDHDRRDQRRILRLHGSAGIVPTEDCVQEMKATTSDYDPEFGETSGMVAQYITKSGTNQVHGSLFYYNRNATRSRPTLLPKRSRARDPMAPDWGLLPPTSISGGSLGGPIKKNKVFLFGATCLTGCDRTPQSLRPFRTPLSEQDISAHSPQPIRSLTRDRECRWHGTYPVHVGRYPECDSNQPDRSCRE